MRFVQSILLATLLSTVFLNACSSDIDVSCEPDCTDLACGPDPICGHSCGTCGDNATCEEGLCECEHQVCNELCCAADEFCRNDRCLLPTDPCFDDTTCAAQHRECISGQDEAICGNCFAGYIDIAGLCEVDCGGRVCGPAPIGDLDCGTCPGATDYCTSEGQCEDDCAGRNCGTSPHESYDCGTCSGTTIYCSSEGRCEDDCAGRVCGPSPHEGYDCGTCPGDDESCTSEGLCVAGCVADCDGKECGDDGCGGSCGDCSNDESCESGTCVAGCAGRVCGPAPGGDLDCGTCPGATDYCTSEGLCEDDCAGRYCGPSPHESHDCGTCSGDTAYCSFEGICVEDCTGRVCGPSPNEGFDCGTCPGATDYCTSSGLCTDDCAGRVCGPSPIEGFDCGSCSVEEKCISGQCAAPEWQDPPSSNSMGWQNAFNYCETLSFDGHDDWRSPTIGELRSLVRGCPDTETNGPCGLTDDCLSYANCHNFYCDGCPLSEGPSEGCYWPDGMQGNCGYYHSSSLRTGTSLVWSLNFLYADFASHTETGVSTYARCIRYSTQ